MTLCSERRNARCDVMISEEKRMVGYFFLRGGIHGVMLCSQRCNAWCDVLFSEEERMVCIVFSEEERMV